MVVRHAAESQAVLADCGVVSAGDAEQRREGEHQGDQEGAPPGPVVLFEHHLHLQRRTEVGGEGNKQSAATKADVERFSLFLGEVQRSESRKAQYLLLSYALHVDREAEEPVDGDEARGEG